MEKSREPLRIERMSLTNFRGIASIDIDFHPQLTLIAGRNGVGKTSLLEGMLGAFNAIQRMRSIAGRPQIPGQFSRKKGSVENPQCLLKFLSVPGFFQAIVNNKTNYFVAKVGVSTEKSLPLLVYYSQERAVSNSRPMHEGDVFHASLSAAPQAVGTFKQWFFDKEADEGSEIRDSGDINFRNSELEAVRKVVTSIDGIDGLTARSENGKERDLYFQKYGQRISIDQLSSGERVYFILAADLARRLIVAFPDEKIETAPGLVMIDEIELHLHPAWQRKIIEQLRSTFRNCQFVITTHSPQVIGGVEAECIRLLTADEEGHVTARTPKASYGRDSGYILEALLDADERVPEVETMLDAARNAIDDRYFDEAERLLTDLADTIEGDAPTVTLLRARLDRLKMQDAS